MCGILGCVQTAPLLSCASFGAMLDTLTHRGPDGRGLKMLEGGKVLLGHRRLAIIDLSQAAVQPMGNDDGTVWLTFNGEIYNYLELRRQLQGCGHCFRSQSDSEVILRAYEEWGVGCIGRLRGIFSFGIWDSTLRELLLVRDPLGVKPLYYGSYRGCFVFASQAKAIVSAPGWPRQADPSALRDYLAFGYVPFDRCAFAGLSKLPAGHLARYRDGRLRVESYWTPTPADDLADPAAALAEQLPLVVRNQLVSDVPVGCFLSGGIDSSLLVALAKPHRPDLRTFTIGFDNPTNDERAYAQAVAEHFGTSHVDERLERQGLEERLLWLPEVFDEPFDGNGASPFSVVAALARRHETKVVLGGDGADELFVGYLRYDDFAGPSISSHGPFARMAITAAQILRRRGLMPARRLQSGDLARYFSYEGCMDDSRLLLTNDCLSRCEGTPLDWLERFVPQDVPAVTAAQMLDLRLYLVDHILCKVDRAAMAHGVEARVPYLDQDLVRNALAIPLARHYRGGRRKALLREIAQRYLPGRMISGRKKGFSSPVAGWFDASARRWAESLLDDGALVCLGLLRPDWLDGLRALSRQSPRLALRPRWLLLGAELWARRWLLPELWPQGDLRGG